MADANAGVDPLEPVSPVVRRISSLEDPELAPYRNLRSQHDHLGGGRFIAEGDKVVRRLLSTRIPIHSMVLPEITWPEFEPLVQAHPRPHSFPIYLAPKSVLEQLTGFALYQGVMAHASVPPPVALDEVLSRPHPRRWIALDGLTSSDNVGAILRTAAAFGIQGVILDSRCAHPYLRRAVRISMGNVFRLDYWMATDLPRALRRLSAAGMRTVAAHAHPGGSTVLDPAWSDEWCLVLGAEGDGLRPEVLAACDEMRLIPMASGVDSLNVAAAAAVFLFAAQQPTRFTSRSA